MEADNEGRRIAKSKAYSGLRKIIGKRMAASLEKSPQAMISTSMDMSALMDFRKELADKGRKVTVTDLLIRIVGYALEKNPAVNASVVDGRYYQYDSVNISVAVGLDEGLYVPVIRDVPQKDLMEISQELKNIVGSLKSGNIKGEFFTGGTFCISNLGMYDIEYTTPIINAPEAAILCVGSTKRTPVVLDNDEIGIQPISVFSLTLDHSAMDGIHGATFLSTIKEVLMAPKDYLDENGNYIGGN